MVALWGLCFQGQGKNAKTVSPLVAENWRQYAQAHDAKLCEVISFLNLNALPRLWTELLANGNSVCKSADKPQCRPTLQLSALHDALAEPLFSRSLPTSVSGMPTGLPCDVDSSEGCIAA